MSQIGLTEAAGQCRPSVYSEYGMYLRGHTFKTVQAGFPGECSLRCEQDVRCQSFNVIIGSIVCELNSRTKEARPEDFVPHQYRFYMKRTKNRVPLGSIPELPAETCTEIKASEGNEMTNSEYWIYSDGNADHAILARCEDAWQKVNTDPVCFGARDDTYGAFSITKTGRVKTMKLVHKSGSIHCNKVDGDSYWGCAHSSYANKLMTFITNINRESLLPPVEDLYHDVSIKKHGYSLDGNGHKSAELVFRNLSSPLFLSRNQELQIWYGQDWVGFSEDNNSGETCVDVYAWYM